MSRGRGKLQDAILRALEEAGGRPLTVDELALRLHGYQGTLSRLERGERKGLLRAGEEARRRWLLRRGLMDATRSQRISIRRAMRSLDTGRTWSVQTHDPPGYDRHVVTVGHVQSRYGGPRRLACWFADGEPDRPVRVLKRQTGAEIGWAIADALAYAATKSGGQDIGDWLRRARRGHRRPQRLLPSWAPGDIPYGWLREVTAVRFEATEPSRRGGVMKIGPWFQVAFERRIRRLIDAGELVALVPPRDDDSRDTGRRRRPISGVRAVPPR